MTDTAVKEIQNGSPMVDVVEELDDFGKPQLTFSSPKFSAKFVVQKETNGYPFFKVLMTKGQVPSTLKGSFSSLEKAREAVELYINGAKESLTVRRDKTYKENHKDKA